MSGPATVALIARREVVERVRQKSFLASTGVTFAIVALVAVLPAILGGDDADRYEVAAAGAGSAEVARAAAEAPRVDARIEVRETGDAAAAERAVRDEEVDAAVVDGRRLLALGELPDSLGEALQAGARQLRVARLFDAPAGQVQQSSARCS